MGLCSCCLTIAGIRMRGSSLLLLLFLQLSRSKKFLVDPERNRILDGFGRERIFHGENVVMKTTPFVPITTHFDARYSFVEEDAKLLASMGHNTIRLGVLWAGLEPVEGQYNMSYLEEIQKCVDTAEKFGLHPVLDMHQDVFNRRFCGNGVPDWVPQPDEFNFPYPIEVEYEVDENGYPSREDCDKVQWPNYHFSTSLSHSVGNLYKNYDGLLDRFAAFWGLVAQTFADRDSVIGYEIMNDPWCGDIFEDPTLLFPGVADRRYLEPMYDRVNQEIRKYDEEHIILFEGVTWEVTGIGEALGFTHPPGGFDYSNRSILSFHHSVQEEIATNEQFFQYKWQEIQRLGLAGFVTEINTCCLDLADQVTWLYSWHHWAFKTYGKWTWDSTYYFDLGEDINNYDCPNITSCLRMDRATTYARTYPAAIAGTAKYFTFNDETSEALLVFQPDPNIAQPTELRVATQWRYPAGVEIVVIPPGLASWRFGSVEDGLAAEVANSTVLISLTGAWAGEELSVTV